MFTSALGGCRWASATLVLFGQLWRGPSQSAGGRGGSRSSTTSMTLPSSAPPRQRPRRSGRRSWPTSWSWGWPRTSRRRWGWPHSGPSSWVSSSTPTRCACTCPRTGWTSWRLLSSSCWPRTMRLPRGSWHRWQARPCRWRLRSLQSVVSPERPTTSSGLRRGSGMLKSQSRRQPRRSCWNVSSGSRLGTDWAHPSGAPWGLQSSGL